MIYDRQPKARKGAKCQQRNIVTALGFILNALATALVPFIVLPGSLVISGQSGWASIAVGMACGGLASIVIGLGWPISGTVKVAATSIEYRWSLYVDSLRSRGVVAPGALGVGATIAYALSPMPNLAALTCFSASLVGLSASWYYIGCGEPVRLLTYFTVVRFGFASIGIWAAAVAHNMYPYAVALGAGEVLSLIISTYDIRHRTHSHAGAGSRLPLRSVIAQQLPAATTALSAGTYVTLPLPIVATIAPSSAAVFAAAQSMLQLGGTVTRPLVQFLQSWAPAGGVDQQSARMRKSIRIALSGALPYALLACSLSYYYVPMLSLHAMRLSWPTAVLLGATAGAILVSQILGLVVLTALGQVTYLMRSTLVGALFGLALLPPAVALFDVPGAWGALFLAELGVTLYQSWVVFRLMRG
jgi:O-antigen/teichoic acid export membrane protein